MLVFLTIGPFKQGLPPLWKIGFIKYKFKHQFYLIGNKISCGVNRDFLWYLTIKGKKCEMNIQFKDLWWNNWMLSCFKNGTCYVGTTKDYYRSTTTYICCVNYSRGIVSWNFDDLNFNFRKNKWLFYSWQIFLCNFSKNVEQFMCRNAKNRAKNLFQKA